MTTMVCNHTFGDIAFQTVRVRNTKDAYYVRFNNEVIIGTFSKSGGEAIARFIEMIEMMYDIDNTQAKIGDLLLIDNKIYCILAFTIENEVPLIECCELGQRVFLGAKQGSLAIDQRLQSYLIDRSKAVLFHFEANKNDLKWINKSEMVSFWAWEKGVTGDLFEYQRQVNVWTREIKLSSVN